ncbi:AraC family transcriptional regulator [Ferruginibacter sp.]|uniref:AraC family transcriptional regulator n=1 Tax=Ferruginibacter sp. TaxID=1940288 RepID=UPI0019A6BB0D|nr:AraC family transcriptional regulator [Ferruginibacter sp.]MBC7628632.1 helix-turn-helix transcriptional regulator [Ferruginibacter sp.]
MKTLIQKIHLEEQQSFACRMYRTPDFETNWHRHEEFELILITEGYGTAMIGDFIGEYKPGDLYFIAGNLPHWFKKQHHKTIGAALVLHFKKEILGNVFLDLPELKNINQLLQKNDGIQIGIKLQKEIAVLLVEIHQLKGFQRMGNLLQCIQKISTTPDFVALTQNFLFSNNHVNPAIEKIIDFSFKRYLTPVTLKQVADVAAMSIPTFCRFFKKNIKKTYFDFIQDLRISHACKLLTSTNKAVMEICYESGYNSWANFSKQFKQVKKITPLQYRKEFDEKNTGGY